MKTYNNKTSYTKKKDQVSNWYIIDAENKILGRLAKTVAEVISGKLKVNYVPYMDMGDNVVIINAKKIAVSGNKEEDKLYHHHSGFPGGLKTATLKQLRAKDARKVLENAISGMTPKTRMGKAMLKKVHIFNDANHKYQSKELKTLKVEE
ncbi:50S ribosomal protein L13 [candidate division CPR3 bacterium GWF2_35_18]|uniref:Large ribosomal subunit protein uL13 n=1 Tax=candidate division CPR3 bacterium GW2011_GWF2_35_18 TaxID=1618350 RepID=A0A0G0E346_UNCC3|nr:MAG: 50S ribosomal protein L13 [candidate division CPR3 bacterium GW2011_GWF2_35_18]KKQ46488.1 MAG: 50S ribosomal protein L13 [Candidatus Moranbacteria bacterium GW2011_GWD2_37_9]OGB63145.1 MAG: 50S ribosomal protein L13 [candidate division CPR3 bacterium GWF2_35_18]OGB64041.1 MAG: 50S ribosomal protein L13 [candidate division CPR3 bacterium RIFOXYA2_FULL_35_13]OGB78238.1 MAG: 50S ribosomal protein L13 [candidate division CPR3 bacterium RIFOXYB2_FULL_35_8]